MNKILRFFLGDGRYSAFHLFAIAFFVTGFFVAFTATELGAVATLLVPIGLYLALFSILLEVLFWLKALGRRVFRARIGA